MSRFDPVMEAVEVRVRERRAGNDLTNLDAGTLQNLSAGELRQHERRAMKLQRRHAKRTFMHPIWGGGRMRRAIDTAVAAAIEAAYFALLAERLEELDASWRRRKEPPVKLKHALSVKDLHRIRERAVARVQKETAGAPWSPARQREAA